ncbi:MAG TPA: ABC transporter substrate-binding protein [Phenylobacterium sp.]|nr:ABC transporter substrate-binding protein [Phenylobacterium sp.]
MTKPSLRLLALIAVAALAWFAIDLSRHRATTGAHSGNRVSARAPGRPASKQCPKVGGVLTFARSADVTDWYYNLDNPSISAWPLVNLPLVRNNIDATAVEGMAATSWEANADSTVFTFHLRDGLRFSDGTSLTSADVLDSFQRNYADPKSTLKSRIPQAVFSAPDANTFVIRLAQTYPAFVEQQLPGIGIHPKGADPRVMMEAPVSAGPFVLAGWRKGQMARLIRNPYYWNQPYPCLDELRLNVVGDSATQAIQLRAGQVDAVQDPLPSQLVELERAPHVLVKVFPTLAGSLIRLQRVKQPAFADVNVRKAMNYAIDKEAIANVVFFGTAKPMDSEAPRTKFYAPQTPYAYDLAKARALMAQSKYRNGFRTELLIASGDPVESGIATIVKYQLAKIGITVKIQQVEAGTKFQLRGNKQFEMFLASTSADQIDPEGYWEFCCAAGFGFDSAWTDYRSPEMIALFAEAKRVAGARRAELFAQMQKIGWDDAAQLYLVFVDAPIAMRDRVHGYRSTPTRHLYLETVYLD